MTDQHPIHASWTPRYEDWVEANRELQTTKGRLRDLGLVWLGLAAAIVGLVLRESFFIVYGLAVAVAYYAYDRWMKPRVERKRIWNTSEAKVHGAEVFIDLERGPTFVYGPTKVVLDWPAIVKVRESEHHFILLPVGDRSMHVLPKEPVFDTATVDTLRTVLRERIGERHGDDAARLREPKPIDEGRAPTT